MKEILIALCGTSPAVVTETVWAMAHEDPPRLPDRVIVLTTLKGRECVRNQLFQNKIWEQLRQAVKASDRQLCFGETGDSIRVFTDTTRGRELNDIQSETDGVAVGNFILENLRQFTETPVTRIKFSIAGGRKTMSALGALAMTLLSREEDRLCHVLVSPPFDTPMLVPLFYFPCGQIHADKKGNEFPDTQATITLHDIPFPRCRKVFPCEYGRLPKSFADTVNLTNETLTTESAPKVKIVPQKYECGINGRELRLSREEFDFFWMLLERVVNQYSLIDNAYCLYDAFCVFVKERREENMASPGEASEAKMRRLASRIKKKLQALENVSRVGCLFPSRGRNKGYGLTIPPERVEIVTEMTAVTRMI